MGFEQFDVVRVPFPFTDRTATKNRPALVLSKSAFNNAADHSVLVMITSAINNWPLDCPIQDIQAAGLPAPSRIRFKLFTLDNRLIRGKIGALSAVDAKAFKKQFDRLVATGSQSPQERLFLNPVTKCLNPGVAFITCLIEQAIRIG